MRLTLDHPHVAVALLLASLAAIAIAMARRAAFRRSSAFLDATALALLALAAGGLRFQIAPPGPLYVMVDCSASTRGADYRFPAELRRRIAALTGGAPYRIIFFARDNAPDLLTPMPDPFVEMTEQPLPDLPGDATRYAPPADAVAVLLFSDCQFPLPPAAPPTFIAFDPNLEHPADAAVTQLNVNGGVVSAIVHDAGPPRSLHLANEIHYVGPGTMLFTSPELPGGTTVNAQLSPGDLWPENDRLTTTIPRTETSTRWWVGSGAPPGWTPFAPAALPSDAAAYLAPAAIALNNIDAAALSSAQIDRLDQFVRDLGGTLILLGGDHAFGVGRYGGTKLDAISPLAATAPGPATRWVLLADSSGSMAAPASADSDVSRFRLAGGALAQMLADLPPNDPVDIGSFSQDLHWWTRGQRASQAANLPLPPPVAAPNGPTNFVAALRDIAADDAADSQATPMPTQLIVLTDADVQIDDPAGLIALLNRRQIHLSVLAIGQGSGMDVLRRVCQSTGGTVQSQFDPTQWSRAAAALVRQFNAPLLHRTPIDVTYFPPLSLPPRTVDLWNHTWQRPGSATLANGADGNIPLAAQWQSGAGKVAAVAFSANAIEVAAIARTFAQRPVDPRFAVTWQNDRTCMVTLSAIDGKKYLNGLQAAVEIADAQTAAPLETIPMPQTAPGEYSAQWPARTEPTIAAVRVGGAVVARQALAGRYPEEFDHIGNNHTAMERLAALTGGAVVPETQTTPIRFTGAANGVFLTPWLAILGAICISCSLLPLRRY